ncbi:hypothetical protein SKAU_G00054420 [Synaphobranchus kaupii]|uniref:Uncharacterized protein n=1 Tax=Synaphobranchus kaupii TaxID=118154 RepID=A0A9Q1G4Q0_SYNKA|nr:hypothetical protein SKAU_G00054420 [Synaphobranchus kaupii]
MVKTRDVEASCSRSPDTRPNKDVPRHMIPRVGQGLCAPPIPRDWDSVLLVCIVALSSPSIASVFTIEQNFTAQTALRCDSNSAVCTGTAGSQPGTQDNV